jgi:hypothetical protein
MLKSNNSTKPLKVGWPAHDRRRDEARLQAIKDTPEYRNTGYSALKAAIDRVYSNTSTEAGK